MSETNTKGPQYVGPCFMGGKKMFDTVLFDLDGTIMNTEEGITEGVRYALEKMHLPPLPFEIRRLFIGPPLRESFVAYCGVDADAAEMLLKEYRVFYAEKGLHLAKPYAGIRTLLEDLTAHGKELFVATAKPTIYSRTILEEWELDGFFKEIVGAGFDKNFDSKDKIVGLAKSMATHKDIVMVGDTKYDVEGARANGIPVIGVLYGFGKHEELFATKPDYIVNTVEEIGGLI